VRAPRYVHPRLDSTERFRERRRQARIKRRRRRVAALTILLGVGTGLGVGATHIPGNAKRTATPAVGKPPIVVDAKRAIGPRPWPRDVRGVHVTMALAGLEGKIDGYLALRHYGLNTLEVDVKDESGRVGFLKGAPALARTIGAAGPFYNARAVARQVHARGVYLIGRVVAFEDPVLAQARPELAIQNSDGSVWRNNAGLGWTNPYDKRVWKYVVDVAVAAAKAGFDEIQFDYVRFPSDGDLSQIVYAHRRAEPKGTTIARFLQYASKRLRPLNVRISADLFGLAATHDLGIGQVPKRIAPYVDALYPMVYPSHYRSGEYRIDDPNKYPGRTVARALLDFRRQLKGQKVTLIPWLQDFSLGAPYTLIEVTDQIAAARRQHTRGYMLWNPEGVYTREALSH
jgi:hypothetical protein